MQRPSTCLGAGRPIAADPILQAKVLTASNREMMHQYFQKVPSKKLPNVRVFCRCFVKLVQAAGSTNF